MVNKIMSLWSGNKKTKALDSATKSGITTWLRRSISRSFRAHDHKLVTKFERALLEFRRGNYTEAKWCMEEIHSALETMRKYDRLTRAQFIEKRILTIWLEKLGRL